MSNKLSELQKIEFEILCHIDEFCNKNGINYYLAYGSLLGAVRHQGFIPWDDDMDIFMLREDYDKFVSLYNNNDSKYKFVCFENNHKYYIPFGKVIDSETELVESVANPIKIGVFVDVYPLDSVPGSYDEVLGYINNKYIARLFKVLTIKNLIFKKRKLSKNLLLFFGKACTLLISREMVLKRIIAYYKKYRNSQSEYVCSLCTINSRRDIFKKEFFKDKTMVTINGKEFFAPINYKEVLIRLYGDYMELPSIEQRVPHHNFVAFKNGKTLK